MNSLQRLIPPAGNNQWHQGRKVVKRALKHLDRLSTDPALLQQLDIYYENPRSIHFARARFPELPKAHDPPHIIEKYLQKIIHTRFSGQEDTSAMIKQLWDGPYTLTDESTNLILAYYARAGDPHAIYNCLQSICATVPQFFNHWLYSIYTQRRSASKDYTVSSIIPILASMREAECAANGQTWNMAMLTMPSSHGLRAIYDEMCVRGIPLGNDAASSITSYLISTVGFEKLAKTVVQDPTVPMAMVNQILRKMLQNRKNQNVNVFEAFDFINLWASNGGVPNSSTLDVFLRHFASRGHLDWQIGLYDFFQTEYNVDLTSRSWQHILNCAWQLNESPQKYSALGMLIKEASKLALSDHSKAYIKLAFNLAKANNRTITHPGQHVWSHLKQRLSWRQAQGPPDYAQDQEAARAAAIIGFSDLKPSIPIHRTQLGEIGIKEHLFVHS